MIKTLNFIGGWITLILAYSLLKSSRPFKIKYSKIENNIYKNLDKNIELPDKLVNAIIAIEDERYYSHLGVDFYSIFRAIRNSFTKKRKEGASTISQQLVRIILNKREIKFTRKINEILLSVFINYKFSKKQLIACYCFIYPFDICSGIFNLCKLEKIVLNNLTFNEACQIAARFKYPALRKSNYSKYLKRVRIIEIKTTPNGYKSWRGSVVRYRRILVPSFCPVGLERSPKIRHAS